ncbi:homeobox-containing protein 1 isoform X7 [Macaca nemestrina]|nr:homeobox-containing protein 1 isoform X7 [Chlorocebus sabaeus]XP_011740097.1 homeobox-containing protein 1 isoform X7 [Macaca nemestrina]XP_011900990.1 PREDICTED: homeobox-containing protein 1 isoform X7 [Cercocebus atys]XP_015000579.1 homeobox-containing protein 1 isoform X7 [Macaca mulatta]XP_015310125.1 homeobox-containing protein 1 isoform X7 [Macaca fascicularis]XP_017740122.1 PREDICTED: homeobox-containing protein 1 isoform X7 [Rhinopithecus bieti]XP_021798520.1 homeobox-containing p
MLSSFPVVLLETMSHYTDEPRFTIEQIDLLQRLRRTGMTKHEILHALETLDRLDQEHSDKFGRRSSYGGSSYGNSTNNVPASSSTATASTQTQHSGMSPSPSNSYDTSPQPCTTNQNGRENNERLSTSNGKMSPTRYHANSMGQRSYSFEASEEDLDVDDKVEELMRRDSSVIKEEIKAFLANRRISQAVVAQVTGISQSRISHWLLQQGSDLSEQKKRAFYRWYQLEKTNPGATLSMRPAPIPIEDPEWRQTPPPVSATSGTFRLRRGSRFTWRKECLAVMESYFNENQYPDEAKREEIANACNAVIQKPEAAILESHGIDVQSPGGHSNSDDVDGNDYSEQDTWQVRNGEEEEGRSSEGGREAEKDDSTSHSDHQDPISLAVEMAAVNHTILALARQGANEIKTEALDDD